MKFFVHSNRKFRYLVKSPFRSQNIKKYQLLNEGDVISLSYYQFSQLSDYQQSCLMMK